MSKKKKSECQATCGQQGTKPRCTVAAAIFQSTFLGISAHVTSTVTSPQFSTCFSSHIRVPSCSHMHNQTVFASKPIYVIGYCQISTKPTSKLSANLLYFLAYNPHDKYKKIETELELRVVKTGFVILLHGIARKLSQQCKWRFKKALFSCSLQLEVRFLCKCGLYVRKCDSNADTRLSMAGHTQMPAEQITTKNL